MEILRRNTDYALRLILNLAGNYGKGVVSSRVLAEEEDVSYQLTCKLMQKLHAAGFVESHMGPKGGFFLSKDPSEITLAAIVQVIQGPVRVNSCFLGIQLCSKQSDCPINSELSELQDYIDNFLNRITLKKMMKSRS